MNPSTILVVMAEDTKCQDNCLPEEVRTLWPTFCQDMKNKDADSRTDGTRIVYAVKAKPTINPARGVVENLRELCRQTLPIGTHVRVVLHGQNARYLVNVATPEAALLNCFPGHAELPCQ